MLAYEFKVGTASGIYFSSWFAPGMLTTPIQLHVGLQYPGGLAAGWNTLPRVTPYSGQTGETPWGGIGDHLAWLPWHPGRAGGQLCALAMCCHLLSAMMPDHVLGIRCFPFYLLFISVWNKHTAEHLCTAAIQTAEHLCTAVQSHLYTLYCLYFNTVQTFIGLHINLFSQPQQSHDKLDTQSSKTIQEGRWKDGRRTDSVLEVRASHSLKKK